MNWEPVWIEPLFMSSKYIFFEKKKKLHELLDLDNLIWLLNSNLIKIERAIIGLNIIELYN